MDVLVVGGPVTIWQAPTPSNRSKEIVAIYCYLHWQVYRRDQRHIQSFRVSHNVGRCLRLHDIIAFFG